MTRPLEPGSVWVLIAVIGTGTFALRLSFIQLYASMEEFPPRIDRALRFVPVAVLAALIAPALLSLDGLLGGSPLDPHLVAGTVAFVVAWRTNSMTATIAVGMGVFWGIGVAVG